MTSLLKIGLALAAVTFILVLVHPAEADDEVKRKRVIIKIPHRVKHIYHHHTKKIHIHKKKPKPKPKKKKPHKHVHVVVEEEEIVQPTKLWKSIHHAYKGGKGGWSDWKSSPSSLKHSIRYHDDLWGSPGSTRYEEDFDFEDDRETHESRPHGKGSSGRGGNSSLSSSKGKKSKKKGGSSSKYSFKHSEDPSYDASYEVAHHSDHDTDGYDPDDVPRRKPKRPKTSSFTPSSSSSHKNKKGFSNRPSNKKPKKRPYFEDKYTEPDDYDELYDRGPAYPERKEHPSWHERSRDLAEAQSGSHPRPDIWTIPKVPEVNEFIDDAKDVPDPGIAYGFYPSNFNPITTVTASVVQNSPEVPPPRQPFEPVAPAATVPKSPYEPSVIVPKPIKNPKKPKKNPGYLSQVSSTSDGQPVGYRSHVGHSLDSPSSSFQAVSFGTKLHRV